MVTEYCVEMVVTLEPVGQPWVSISVNNQEQTKQLKNIETFNFKFNSEAGNCKLIIDHFKKEDSDPVTAVIVKDVSFFGITDPKFAWAGVYVPNYPAHYKNKIPVLPGQTYMGWNGQYTLTFTVPVFTWIHQIQNLGWLYQ